MKVVSKTKFFGAAAVAVVVTVAVAVAVVGRLVVLPCLEWNPCHDLARFW